MIIRYSTCHFAPTMEEVLHDLVMGERCSFCGEPCHLVPMPFTVRHDIELTLRRWKDGDCTLDDMFDRLNKEFHRAWNEVFEIAQGRLQGKKKPKFEWEPKTMSWKSTKLTDNPERI